MPAVQIRYVLEKNIREIGPVKGINNHEGSAVTSDAAAMEAVLDFCKENGLYYLDSRTTANTVAGAVAKRLGITILERNVSFLDNIHEKSAIIGYINEGLQKAEKQGSAVMIGHVFTQELADTLQALYPELVEEGYSLSFIAKVAMGKADNDADIGD